MESNTNPFTHNIMDKSDTPELDALRDECEEAKHTHAECEHLLWRLCRKLERERDAAIAVISAIEERYIDGWDTYEDWKFMGRAARAFLENVHVDTSPPQ
jgi:hypothetical protein